MDAQGTLRAESTLGDLSEALKEATKDVHVQAENTEFMRNFQKGQVSLRDFKLVMSSLYYIYEALEEEIERNKEHPAYAPVYFPLELHRRAALEEDLQYFYGPSWKQEIPCPEATRRYVERLQHVGQQEPELLVAHAYTRYLGDLSGGQVLKKIAQKALHLPASGEGLAFFSFDAVSSATKFKQLYRSRMNSIDMDDSTKARILEEAKTAFLLNIKVFEALQEMASRPEQNGQLNLEKSELRKQDFSKANGPTSTRENGPKESQKQLAMGVSFLRWALIFSVAVLSVAVGLYAL
ncbi:heme oxygenase 1 [Microcaecilia unicolor]|uniref:heme oxygenase (biliverdin-producing) n=1 Tax=Microcaecilia unicolor TaxID=1415580 RepID=A0A6P7YCJ8_9AMPH|nr:heme oxygenase 1 [Microcaecilia unicolor]